MKPIDIDNVRYRCYPYNRQTIHKESIHPIGLDTEAYTTGRCFMIATSTGDVFRPEQFPACFFSRQYRGSTFVAYNLKYDEGALVQHLPMDNLQELRQHDSTVYEGFSYRVIASKCFTIRRGKNSIHIYDMLNFYLLKLEEAASIYLGEHKLEGNVKRYTREYVVEHWQEISSYCVQDARLVERLADVIIKRFESYGVYPRKLYSTAYVSFQYFRTHTPYVTVKKYWEKHKEVLQYSLWAYNGGKFEVTTKGAGYYYEYDIVSAYPFEIRNLIDISWARVVRESKYRRNAIYGFLKVKIKIPYEVATTTVVKRSGVNCYMVGEYETYISKQEYDYLISVNCDITILDAYWIHCDNRQYPYRQEIDRLAILKEGFKQEGNELDYHTIKILMNSLYGKMCQLIGKDKHYEASSCWNPIYAAVITANTRIRVSSYQSIHRSVVAVHTDSILSTEALNFPTEGTLGDMIYKTEGEGLVLGAGIYELGDKIKFRGMPGKTSLIETIRDTKKKFELPYIHAYTWREIAMRGWNLDMINRFQDLPKSLNINFDQKRLWLNDWQHWKEVLNRKVESSPLIYSSLLFS